jgi:hypothetical protein
MKNIIIYIALLISAFGLSSCEKNDPITELGTTNGEFSAQLSVSYNNTRPAIGDTVYVTASTWQRDDKFDKIVFYETVFESFGIELKLEKGTGITTTDQVLNNNTYSTLILTDTVKSKEIWNTVGAANLDNYWVTASNNYVIRLPYVVERTDGQYPSDKTLLNSLSDTDFAVLKSLLAYNITREDYLILFPDAPSTHFTNGGTYVLTSVGMTYLRENLSVAKLLGITTSVVKKGTYNVTIDVDAITPSGAKTSSTARTFENII